MNILVAIDLSSASQKIIDKAKTLALALPAKVCLLHVIEGDLDSLDYETDLQDPQEFSHEHKDLQKEVDVLRESGIDTKGLLSQGSIVDVILHKSKQLSIDIIIIGTHGHGGVHHMIFGSVSEGVLRNSSCPVLVIPTHDRE
ncbi:MAG: universal stress protein [Candidatus Scalindua sp.]|jgi:nucleotide-binding universal stress UspA family protein|nr:universal stress protein [Candidatus Scalindua sp.]MBT5304676.1 universal stress protein [Candidatus Scalindua sp.]MBT6046817.1 universal stress protein [Candidatus Scalindua sp.]MBT6227665.1 universal stress protein [Candidatus Scalindua sp.]MBT6564693.1 universal stress protein [Candidatus Scalindua sp.]